MQNQVEHPKYNRHKFPGPQRRGSDHTLEPHRIK